MISNHTNLVEQHRPQAEAISDKIAQYLAAGGRIDELKSPPRNPLPPPRSEKIDPETVLRRRPKPISAADRKALRNGGLTMSKRKPNNGFARAERSCRALLRTNHVAVVNIDPSGVQIMANWKSCRQIRSLAIANALFDFAYQWTIYLSAMCRDDRGVEYVKSVEISPDGIYKVERLTDAIEHYYLELRNSCNPNHLVASGWIAVPAEVSLDEAQAAKLFYAAGAWHQVKVAA